MTDDIRLKKSFELISIISKPYKYGFSTKIKKQKIPTGINTEIISLISALKKEKPFFTKLRLKAYAKWLQMKFPCWANLDTKDLDFNKISYYSAPKQVLSSLGEIDQKIIQTFTKLGISLNEEEKLNSIAVDAVFDSISIHTTYKEKLAKFGVIFCSISTAIQQYPHLIEKFFGTVVSANDNYFAALNTAVFTDGSFCYVPKNTVCPLELSTYFRINDSESGQFERTLIIVEKNSCVSYLEGCTAPKQDKNQLHAAVVELIAFEGAKISYSTVQNWYSGDERGVGGIYNFVTKRGLCLGNHSKITWTQVETGSAITWKYPSCVLLGDYSNGEFYSIALTNSYQQADTGTKMLHFGENSTSKIVSKGISCRFSRNSYRGLVKISENARNSRNFSQCDSFLIGALSTASTLPYFDICNSYSLVEHEAKISRVSEDQLFYLMQRGINAENAIALLVSGFCKNVVTMLPMEFALEASQLLALKLEGSTG